MSFSDQDPELARAPEVWMDSDGCLLAAAPASEHGPGRFVAFGNPRVFEPGELTGDDAPVCQVIDRNGFYVGPPRIYSFPLSEPSWS